MAYTKKTVAPAKAAAPAKIAVEEKVNAVEEVAVNTATSISVEPLTNDTLIPCVQMVKLGKLFYASKTAVGMEIRWEGFGDLQEVEFRELVAMRNSQPKFFSENWISIPDSCKHKDAVLEKLHVKKYYKNDIDPYNMAEIFNLSTEGIVDKIQTMPESLVETFKRFAKESVDNGTLDSIAKIRAIEKALDVSLI